MLSSTRLRHLKHAALNNRFELVSWIMEVYPNLNLDSVWISVLISTVHKVLIQIHDSKLDIMVDNQAALIWAAECGYLDVVATMYARGVDISFRNNYVLQLAAKNGYLDMVRFLHSQGVDITGIASAHQPVAEYLAAKQWLQGLPALVQLAAKTYAKHYGVIMPIMIPQLVTDAITAACL